VERQKLRVEIPDAEYFRRMIKCQYACPAGTDAGGYVQRIAAGDYETAYLLARRPNPFASTCGRVCGAPCEAACRRARIDQPVAIRALKRFVTERHGVESKLGDPGETLMKAYGQLRVLPKSRRGKVAVIGAGPAGLACAHELARMGHHVTVFEAQEVAGGMLILGVPEYRLPRDIVRAEVTAISRLGVEIRTGVQLGRDLTIQGLRELGYEAIFIATGATKSRELRIEGVELDGVLKGVEFLLNVNRGFHVELGEKVVVIGGGNVAVDVARTALRHGLDIEAYRSALRMGEIKDGEGIEERSLAVDVARLALRKGASEVCMVCLESREEMPAYEWEVEAALEEGVKLYPSRGPKRILGDNGKVAGLETIAVASVFDAEGRFNPSFIEGTELVITADTIILSIGQAPDLSFLSADDRVEVTPRGMIAVNPETLSTSAPGVFAGGDAAFGPRLIIDAIADGKKAALSIANYLSARCSLRTAIRVSRVDPHHPYPVYDRLARVNPPQLSTHRRVGMTEVEASYDEATAREQAMRCLRCHLNVIYDSSKCIVCGGCVDICPENCLRFVSLERLELEEGVRVPAETNGGIAVASPESSLLSLGAGSSGALRAAALLMDGDRCIRCGLCVQRCPTGALSLVRFEFAEELNDGAGETITDQFIERVKA